MIDFRDLVKSGVHFGHQTARWNPRMAPYIWGSRNGVHLIDVSKTAHFLEQAAKFLESMAAQDRTILWVGTKKSAQVAIAEAAKGLNMPYVTHRWVGGTLTNYSQVKKSVTKLLHFEDVLGRSGGHHYTKKELTVFQKIVDRLLNSVGGIRTMTWPVGAIVVVDIKKEATVIKEARAAGIPVIALVDTNCDPSSIDYVVPANDDSPKAIRLLIDYLGQAAKRGFDQVAQEKRDARAARAKQAVNFIEASNAEEIAVAISKAELEDEEQAAARRAAAARRGAPTSGHRPAAPSAARMPAYVAPAAHARPAVRPTAPARPMPASVRAPEPAKPVEKAPERVTAPVKPVEKAPVEKAHIEEKAAAKPVKKAPARSHAAAKTKKAAAASPVSTRRAPAARGGAKKATVKK